MTSSQRLAICMVSDDFMPAATGVGTHLQQVTAFLTARGHRILVITTRRPGQPESEEWMGVTIKRMPTLKVFGFYQGLPSKARLAQVIDAFRPDIVHFHYLSSMMLKGMLIAEGRSLPIVYTYHMTEDHLTQPLPMRPLRPWIAREIVRLCNRADVVITVSGANLELLPKRGISTPLRFISNPVIFEDTDKVEPVRSGAAFTVMFAGRLNPEKNVPLLLRAFALLLNSLPDVVLWIAGEGTQRAPLEQLSRNLGLGEKVRFLGFLNHEALSGYYAGCDVFVLPSFVETQGLVAMEAMRFGKPLIVARSVISARELVDEDVNGYIVDERSPRELADRLLRLASDPILRDRLGGQGRLKSAQFSPDVVIPMLEQTYREVLSRPSRGQH